MEINLTYARVLLRALKHESYPEDEKILQAIIRALEKWIREN